MTRLAREAGRVPVPLRGRRRRRRPSRLPWWRRCKPIRRSAMSAWCTARPVAALCMTYLRLLPRCARSGDGLSSMLSLRSGLVRSTSPPIPEIDAVVFTSNKCLEGVPGLAFAVCPHRTADRCARQRWKLVARPVPISTRHALRHGWGSFRFTPPAQVLNAFNTALDLYDAEGGQRARLARYTANMRVLYDGVRALGLMPCLLPRGAGADHRQCPRTGRPALGPAEVRRCAEAARLPDQQFLQHAETPSFRVGCIGAITPDDMRRLRRWQCGEALARAWYQPPAGPRDAMSTDLEIARAATLRPIAEIAAQARHPGRSGRALWPIKGEDRLRFHPLAAGAPGRHAGPGHRDQSHPGRRRQDHHHGRPRRCAEPHRQDAP